MARFALIDGGGRVENVIVADEETATAIAAAKSCTAREIVTEDETPATVDAIVSRSCEPGATLTTRDAASHELERATRDGARLVVADFERAPAPQPEPVVEEPIDVELGRRS